MKFRKLSLILCMMLLLLSGMTVYAAECELKIALGKSGTEVGLAVYKTADIREGEYCWLSEYEGIGSELEIMQISTAEEMKSIAEKFCDWIEEYDLTADQTGITDENGSVSFQLDPGAYIIAKTSEKGSMAPVWLVLSENQTEKYMIISPKYTVSPDLNNPDNPGNPDNPDNSGNPDNPDNSGNPDNPDNPGNPNSPGNPTGTQTGDYANVVLWLTVLLAALAGVMVLTKKNFRKNK